MKQVIKLPRDGIKRYSQMKDGSEIKYGLSLFKNMKLKNLKLLIIAMLFATSAAGCKKQKDDDFCLYINSAYIDETILTMINLT